MMSIKSLYSRLPENRTEGVIGCLLIFAGLVLRVRQTLCFEFKDDQARAVINGLCALRDMFLVAAGQPGSGGLPNPAGGPVLTGVIALFGTDAYVFAAAFALLSCLTVFGVWWAMYDVLGRRRAWWCTVLIAVSPVLMWNASNLWGPGLLIFFTALLLRGCVKHVEDAGNPWHLVLAGGAAAVGAWMFHLSGLFLFPGMVYAMIRRRPCWKSFAALAGLGAVLFGPWIYTLLFVWDQRTMPMVSLWSEKICAWFCQLASFGNGLFFLNYFPREEWSWVGIAGVGLSAVLAFILFAGGLTRWRDAGEADRVAMLLTVSIPVLYLMLGMRIYPHYLMVILLPVCVISSHFPAKGGRRRLGILAGACLLMLTTTRFWQNRVLIGNGHWLEFGPSGNYLAGIASELDGPQIWALQIVAADEKARKKLDPIACMYIFDRHMQKNGRPNVLILEWDSRGQMFRHRFQVPVR